MTKYRIVNLFDRVVLSFATFLFFYSWINFYARNLYIAFFASLALSFSTIYVFSTIFNKRKVKISQAKDNEKLIEKKLFCFKMLSKSEKFDVILNKFKNFSIKNINRTKQTFELENKKYQIILATHLEDLTQKDLINLLDENLEKDINKIIVVCEKFNPTINKNVFVNKEIIFVDKMQLSSEYISDETFDKIKSNIQFEKLRLNKKEIFFLIFNPKKSKPYFLCGLVLIFSSIILPYQTYYVVTGSMLMLFAIICKILKIYY